MALSEYGVFQNPSVSSIYVSHFNGHTLVVTSFSDTPNYHIRCLFTYFVDCIIYPHDTPMISPLNSSLGRSNPMVSTNFSCSPDAKARSQHAFRAVGGEGHAFVSLEASLKHQQEPPHGWIFVLLGNS